MKSKKPTKTVQKDVKSIVSFLSKILNFVISIFRGTSDSISQEKKIKENTIKFQEEKDMVNWDDPKSKISKYFTVHEATFLPSWRIYHRPSEEEKKEIVKLAKIMDIIRERVGSPVMVHVWIRPKSVNCPSSNKHGQDYNLFIGSKSTKSGHIFGQAIDFHVSGFSGPSGCHEIRQKILPWLEELDIRMEDIAGGWVHIDTKPVGFARFFKP